MAVPIEVKKTVWPAALFITALAIRIPWLWEIPRYVDELREINLAYSIYLKQASPLHNVARDIGAMHNYILAGVFALFGPNPYWPRLYVAVTSAATVVLMYYLGKRLYNRWTGVIAAGLLIGNGMHILVTHMAWANCTTPFFFTLALLGTVIAEQKKSGNWLMLSGLLWAMVLQTHASAFIYLVTVITYVVSRFRESGIDIKYYYRAAGFWLAGYANMVIYNLISGFDSVRSIFGKQYTLEPHPGIVSFAANFGGMFSELLRSVSSTYQNHHRLWQFFAHPQFTICLVLLCGGIYLSLKANHERKLPVWMIFAGFLLIPWINHRYYFFIVTRYIMPIIICATLMIACAAAHLLKTVCIKVGNGRKILIPAIFVLIMISAVQIRVFYNYCQSISNTDLSNRISVRALQTVKTYAGHNKTTVLLDKKLAAKDEPLPLLFRFSNLKFITLPAGPLITRKLDFAEFKARYRIPPGEKMVAVLTQESYRRLKKVLPVTQKRGLFQRLILHVTPGDNKSEVIWIAKIARL